ncbi:MAG: Bax inhibitor-1/YccA family protein [Muribaculaceae bacterium]|nr:Bax inhibitor-1/YccA family protein [Muribaculaceae bacterium]
MNQYDYEYSSPAPLATTVNSTMKRVYLKMTLGLIVTAFTALWAATSPAYINFFVGHPWIMIALIVAELGFVIAISAGINKLSSGMATLLFYLFAIINGLMLFTVFIAYSPAVIIKTFFITAGTFGAMTIYGYLTSNDLSKFGTYLIMALFGLIIASVVNIFMKSSSLDWIISIVGVLIFIGLTAWDTQQIKTMAMTADGDAANKLATIGALSLYLDFINLFLYLLRIFGRRD